MAEEEPIVTYGNEEYGGEEEAKVEDKLPEDIAQTYNFYGIVSLWSIALGYQLYTYYPALMSTDTWWKLQCPEKAYDTTSAAALITGNTANCPTPTATCPAIVLKRSNRTGGEIGWTLADCQNAKPIGEWSIVAYTLMVVNACIALVWTANTAVGNNGNIIHAIFYRTFQLSAGTTLLTLFLEYLAITSYGLEADVYKSW